MKSVNDKKMVRIIKYINKKKYVHDTKMGRQWRVPGVQQGSRKGKTVESEGGQPG